MSFDKAAKALRVAAALPWVVEHKYGPTGYWEPIAAFNVESVAKNYASECEAANGRPYRVVPLEGEA